jgi:HEAT repeats/Putative zinc-finger
MNCVDVKSQIVFYVYGEISSDVEERVESHLEGCADCQAELARHRVFLQAMGQRDEFSDDASLAECRADLRDSLGHTAPAKEPAPWPGWLESLHRFSGFHIPFLIPVGAMALVLLGWLGAHYAPEKFGGVRAGLGAPMFSSVRSVVPDGAGKVQIAVDDVQRRVVVGDLRDQRIQTLLLTAVRDESNPGVRVESLGFLQNSGDSQEVRRVLIDSATHDPNAGVRLKAVEALKQYGGDEAVRKTMANILMHDEDPGIRVQAIGVLTDHHDASIVGVLQDVVQKDDNDYVRTRCRNLLETMKASVGTY